MMQPVTCVERPEDADYRPRTRVATATDAGRDVDLVYPKPSRALMYRQSMSFIDPNTTGYQLFPGFSLEVPQL